MKMNKAGVRDGWTDMSVCTLLTTVLRYSVHSALPIIPSQAEYVITQDNPNSMVGWKFCQRSVYVKAHAKKTLRL